MTKAKELELELEKQKEELSSLLKDKKFRDWIWRLLCECKFFSSTSTTDPQLLALLSGRRDIGLWIIEQIGVSQSDVFGILMSENGGQ